jgi:membrane protein YdbS with pleckstrin-like domain
MQKFNMPVTKKKKKEVIVFFNLTDGIIACDTNSSLYQMHLQCMFSIYAGIFVFIFVLIMCNYVLVFVYRAVLYSNNF